ncbi:MAG: YcxB family protein [Luteolibacter sp.]|uniref:YcxB family protein n=1 Tax=Luteolibacter sp. TaxID=1962973 RepID=UPI0032673E43
MNQSIIRRYFDSLRETEEIKWTTSESGIEVITTNSRWELKWLGIPCVISTPDGFLYQFDSKNYYFLPSRAFSTPVDIENIKALARQHATDFKELK